MAEKMGLPPYPIDVGFSGKGELFNLGGIPTEIRFYAFCYCVHPAFPAIYSSMKDRSQFSKVLVICFSLSTLIYTSIAILGYSMFGQNVMYPVLIFNLPVGEISSKIAIYFMLAAPLPRYAMMSRRLATVMESCLPSYYNNKPMSLLIRSLLLISTVIVALAFPFSVYLMTPTIAFLSVTASILLPCICYLKIFEVYRMWGYELVILVGVMILGISIGCMSIYSSIKEMVMHF
ncbi:hypothetical protein HHK36_024679 [Tetracentron sinense]|uniref:Amino acid transporter transmembrane domain-containing protein n=1 Tax=Tetracentron sinense TaxID=13715 RepID=A0A834YQG6_TETSI|nr:hypothetical protein HHK36_024679 [Tetracentron sinense]